MLDLVRRLPSEARATVQAQLARALVSEPFRIETPRGPLLFAVLGRTSAFRARGLLTKQRGTIAWIDSFQPGSVFWDIGANIGSYALYAALRRDVKVVAFEPAAVNYFLTGGPYCELRIWRAPRLHPARPRCGQGCRSPRAVTVRTRALVQLSRTGAATAVEPAGILDFVDGSARRGVRDPVSPATTSRSTCRR